MFTRTADRICNWLVAIALVVAAFSLVRSCVDTTPVVVPVQLPPLRFVDITPDVHTAIGQGGDRVVILRLQREVDSLRKLIARAGGRTIFRTDTLLTTTTQPDGVRPTAPDTITVECDETNRTITMNVRPSIRFVEVPSQRVPTLTAFTEGGAYYDVATLEPRAAVGCLLGINERMTVILAAEARMTPHQIRAGINAALRWTF